jgi:hypothetical protein
MESVILFGRSMAMIMAWVLATSAWALPCQNPGARYTTIRSEVFDNPIKALNDARRALQLAGKNVSLHTRVVCGLQMSLGAYLSDKMEGKDQAFFRTAIQLGKNSPFKAEIALLEALRYNFDSQRPRDLQDRVRALETVTRTMPLPVRALLLYLTIELVDDPAYKASLEAEVELLLTPVHDTAAFERVLLLEYQAFHVDRNRNPQKKIELRESFLPTLRQLKLAYW